MAGERRHKYRNGHATARASDLTFTECRLSLNGQVRSLQDMIRHIMERPEAKLATLDGIIGQIERLSFRVQAMRNQFIR
jgi:hypothetical protein